MLHRPLPKCSSINNLIPCVYTSSFCLFFQDKYSGFLSKCRLNYLSLRVITSDEVIRFLITRPDEKAIAKAEAFKAKRKGKKETTQEAAKNE
mgnify:CR=1 FL=1